MDLEMFLTEDFRVIFPLKYAYILTYLMFLLQESKGVFAIIAIIAMHTYVIGFALGLGNHPYI